MKNILLISLIIVASFFSNVMLAQVSVNINIGTPRYYYLQDIESYFDIQASMYIFFSGGKWIHARVLPIYYGYHDINYYHKIIIRDYNGTRPYNYIKYHKGKFPKGHYGSSDKNYWSYKEHKGQSKKSSNHSNGHNGNGNNGNGNNGNGNNGNGNGNGKKK